jgi:hypothetical protein
MHENERSKGDSEVQKWRRMVDGSTRELARQAAAGIGRIRDGDGDPVFPLRFLAQGGGTEHGEAAGDLGFGWGVLYRRRGASAASAVVELGRENQREGVGENE